MEVYVLQHIHTFGDADEDVKLIGVYSTNDRANEAIQRLKKLPGFQDLPDGFSIDRYRIDVDHWTEGYLTIPHNGGS